ncbi:hypothetical protein ACOSQ4_004824 [Xanthoceras sorbifolium]
MRLKASELKDDPMPLLGTLPNLIILELGDWFYRGKKLVYCSKSFPCLEILEFNYVDYDGAIEEWQVEETALPRLRGLTLPERCKFTIPERLRSIPPPGQWQFSRGWPDTPMKYWRLASVLACSSAHRPSASVLACSSAYTLVASGDPSRDSRSASKTIVSCNRVKQRSTITTMLTYPLKHQSWCMIKLMIRDLQQSKELAVIVQLVM